MDDTTRANGYKHGRPEGRDVKPADEIVRKVIEALPAEARLYPDVYAWQVTDALEAATVAPAVDREALEQAAEQVRGVRGLGSETSGHTSTYSVRNWLRARAQAIREARSD